MFFPKSWVLALLDELDDSLRKSVMLEPILDAVPELALRLATIGSFTLTNQSIGHQVGTSQLIFHDIAEFGKEILPPSLFGSKFSLSLKIARGNIIGFDHELAAK